MGNAPSVSIKPLRGVLCKFQTAAGRIRRIVRRPGRLGVGLATLAALASPPAVPGPAAAESVYETWSAESFTLVPRESFQLTVTYDQIQVRNWKLVVDGGDRNCDLNVRRVRDGSLMYQRNDERHHEVQVPWGAGEEVSIVVTNRNIKGAFVVSLLGPPRDQPHASYSYHVNRALDKFAAGQRLAAEDECRSALLADPQDGVAKVLLAGFLRDRLYFDRAAALVDEALAGDLPGGMREVAQTLRSELVKLRAPLPLPVRQGVDEAEGLLTGGRPAEALVVCDKLLDGGLELEAESRSRLLLLRGQSLNALDRNFESLDAFTEALQLSRSKASDSLIYFHMGLLFVEMENLPQAEGSFAMALQNGLPAGLEKQARESLADIEKKLRGDR